MAGLSKYKETGPNKCINTKIKQKKRGNQDILKSDLLGALIGTMRADAVEVLWPEQMNFIID